MPIMPRSRSGPPGRSRIRDIARSLATSGERRVLHQIISTVGSSLVLDEVLEAVVALLSEASAMHACFVYLVEDGGERLVLRAASEPYEHLVGEIALDRGEGLAWWALEHREPAFIRENALADPRVKYVPELEEESFQSLVAVPVLGKDGSPPGSILLHPEAPREFTAAEADFLASSASLVAGAIENAHLYEEMRRRVAELEELTELAETVARAESVDELLPAVTERTRVLLGAATCAAYLMDRGGEQLRLRAGSPAGVEVRDSLKLTELGPGGGRAGSGGAGLAVRPQGRRDPRPPARSGHRSHGTGRRGTQGPVGARTGRRRRSLERLPGRGELPRRLRGSPPCAARLDGP